MSNQIVIIAASVIVGAASGGVVGYILGRKKEAAEAAEYVNEQIGEIRSFYHMKRAEVVEEAQKAKDEADISRRAYERLVEDDAPNRAKYEEYVKEEYGVTVEEPEDENEEVDMGPDGYEPEPFDLRRPDKAFLVSEEEFFVNEDDYDQITFTYFVNDDILLDEKDNPVPNQEEILGDGLGAFVPGAGPDVVYIFNPKLEIGFEVVKDEDSYEEKVYGYSEPIEPRVRKFRGGD